MLDIVSLREEYNTEFRNCFLYNYEGIYCYKDRDGVIVWKKLVGIKHCIILFEYTNTFTCTASNNKKALEMFKRIIKKNNKKESLLGNINNLLYLCTSNKK